MKKKIVLTVKLCILFTFFLSCSKGNKKINYINSPLVNLELIKKEKKEEKKEKVNISSEYNFLFNDWNLVIEIDDNQIICNDKVSINISFDKNYPNFIFLKDAFGITRKLKYLVDDVFIEDNYFDLYLEEMLITHSENIITFGNSKLTGRRQIFIKEKSKINDYEILELLQKDYKYSILTPYENFDISKVSFGMKKIYYNQDYTISYTDSNGKKINNEDINYKEEYNQEIKYDNIKINITHNSNENESIIKLFKIFDSKTNLIYEKSYSTDFYLYGYVKNHLIFRSLYDEVITDTILIDISNKKEIFNEMQYTDAYQYLDQNILIFYLFDKKLENPFFLSKEGYGNLIVTYKFKIYQYFLSEKKFIDTGKFYEFETIILEQ